jgi:hypothetical protein
MSTITEQKPTETIPATEEVAQELYIRRGKFLPITCQQVSEAFSIDGLDVNATALQFRILVNDRKLKQSKRELGDLAHDWHFDCDPEEWCRVLADPETNASPRKWTLRLYRSLRARRLELEELAKQPKPLSELIAGLLSASRSGHLNEKKQRLGRLLAVLVVSRDANLIGSIVEAADDLGVTDAAIANRVGFLERALIFEETYKSFSGNVAEPIRADYIRQIREKAADMPYCYDHSVDPPMLWRTL